MLVSVVFPLSTPAIADAPMGPNLFPEPRAHGGGGGGDDADVMR